MFLNSPENSLIQFELNFICLTILFLENLHIYVRILLDKEKANKTLKLPSLFKEYSNL